MWPAILLLTTMQVAAPASQQANPQTSPLKGTKTEQATVAAIAKSGRWAEGGETPDERVAPQQRIAPGPPPVLSFRFYEGKINHRFGNSELLLDDAGH